MDAIFQFLKSIKELAFATVNSHGKPCLRVFQVMKIADNTIYFATARTKEVYLQLQNNPNFEVLGMADKVSVRLTGIANFEVSTEIAKEIFDENKVLQDIYKSFENNVLVFFEMNISKAELYNLNTNPPTRKFYNL